ncbi:MAG: PAS domain-containing protein [Cyanobacteriota bacterium]
MSSTLQNHPVDDLQASSLAEMSAELERYQGLLQSLSDVTKAKVSYIDKEQRYRFVNKQYEHWYNTTADQILGKTVQALMGEQYQLVKPYVDSVLSGHEAKYDFMFSFPDGKQRHLSVTNIPHFNDASEVIGIFVICVDITE